MTEENKQQTRDDEIDHLEVALKIWAERRFILKVVLIFFVIGLVIAFGSKKEYKSEVTMIAEDNSGGSRMSGLMAQFGGLAGLNLGNMESGDVISPELYPSIVQSTAFMLKVLEHKVFFEVHDSTYNLYYYFTEVDKPSFVGNLKGYTIGLPGKIIGLFRRNEEATVLTTKNAYTKEGLIKITKKQAEVIDNLKNRISVSLDEKTGIISIGVELPDAYAAADLVNLIVQDLTAYLIDYRTQKALTDLQFIEQQYAQAEEKFEKAQEVLARFRDQNINVISARANTKEERLQAEYNLAFNVYNGLAQQLEQAKIEVQEKTPVFKVVNEAKVALERSKPKRSLVLVVMLFTGGVLGIGLVILKMVWGDLRGSINSKNE